jgi:uncharacterized repeat protein (TIGR02543 family)
VRGAAALNGGGLAWVYGVSCAAAGDCAAGGPYTDGSGHEQAFVVNETKGVWGTAIEVPGTAALNSGGEAILYSVSCAAVGECAAGGSYKDASGNRQAFVASETNGVWGNAIEVPGTAALNGGGDADVISVSCAAVGECVAGGSYTDGPGHLPAAFVVNETKGVWGNANAIAVPSGWGEPTIGSVSCAAVGECAAGGSYEDASTHIQAFVVSETNGVWGNAIEVPGTAALNTLGEADAISVSCGAAGDCAAGGWYVDGNDRAQAFVVTETNGVWGNAIEVPGAAALSGGAGASVYSVSCDAPGDCAAAGYYLENSGNRQNLVVNETNGVWGNAIEVPGTAALNSGGGYQGASTYSVSCAAAGNCAAGGYYTDGSGHHQVFVANETNGVWGNAIEVPGTAALNSGGLDFLYSVSCAAAGDCAAGGAYTDGSGNLQTLVASETNGVWGDATPVPGTALFSVIYVGNGATGGSVPSDGSSPYQDGATVTVLGAGNLTRTGYSFNGWNTAANGSGAAYHPGDTFSMPASVVTLYAQWTINSYAVAYAGNGATGGSVPTDGSSPHKYGTTVTVLGAGSLTRTGYEFNGWNTAANGSGTSYSPGGTFKMPASALTLYARWAKHLSAGTTTCKGTYSGTGSSVVVPAFATCTLVPGTHVKTTVIVTPRGTLLVSGVTIGGKLTMSGSATVCASKIVGAVVATGGSFALGGPACSGNTITGNILVTNDANNVWVWHNTVKNGHSLTVKYGAGATDSIVANTVSGKLLVEYSGPPVQVSKNHAATATCVHNKGQTGSGNVATGTNTCPH